SGSTVCTTLPLLAWKLGPSEKAATIVCDPIASADVVNEACPAASTGVGPARIVAPSLNVTFPVTGRWLVTVAGNVTGSPPSEGFGDDTTVVCVGASEMALRMTMLSTATPHVCPGRTSAQVLTPSCVYSHRSCTVRPAMPGSLRCTCLTPFEKPAHADRSCRYVAADAPLRGMCFG